MARLNAGLVVTVSARALIMRDPIDGSFAHDGTRPHRARRRLRSSAPWDPSASRSGRSTTMRTPSVGATFHDGGRSRTSSATDSSAKVSARSWAWRNEA